MVRYFLAVFLASASTTIAQAQQNAYEVQSSEPKYLVAFKDMLYFTANDGIRGNELWRYDPKSDRVEQVADVTPGEYGSQIDSPLVTADALWFRVMDEHGAGELWKSDGEPGGETRRVWKRTSGTDRNGVGALLSEVEAGLIFTISGTGQSHEFLLLHTDGVTVSHIIAPDGFPLAAENVHFSTHQGSMYFGARDAHGTGLWRTDGTPESTRLLRRFKNFPTPSVSLGEAGLFVVAETEEEGIELWHTLGEPEDTRPVLDIYPGNESSRPADMRLDLSTKPGQAPRVYFAATHPDSGRELWRSDGTADGTVLAQDIVPGRDSSNPYRIETSPTSMYLLATTPETGTELWAAAVEGDGYMPLQMCREGLPGPASSEPYAMCLNGDGQLFFAQRGPDGEEFWYADAYPNSASQLLDINPKGNSEPFWPARVDGRVYFSAFDPVHGRELWMEQGRHRPPRLIKDLRTDASINPSSSPTEFAALGDLLLFAANDIANGNELWVSDGTKAGTIMLKDIAVGLPSSNPSQITPVGSLAYFQAESLRYGVELWVTDGTSGGTIQVADINPEEASSNPDNLIALGDSLIFMAQSPQEGNELWVLRPGREPTTFHYIRGGKDSTVARNFFVWKGFVYFQADDGVHGEELWRTDGTAAGTTMVKDIVEAPFEPLSVSLAHPVGDRLFLSGRSASAGRELWVWDDSGQVPRLVRDIAPPSLLDTRARK